MMIQTQTLVELVGGETISASTVNLVVAPPLAERIKLLVEYGTDISIKDQDGFTAYDYAVKYNRTELYDLLKP